MRFPLAHVIRGQGDCLPDSVAVQEHQGTMDDWMQSRARRSIDVRKRVCDFLEASPNATITGVTLLIVSRDRLLRLTVVCVLVYRRISKCRS